LYFRGNVDGNKRRKWKVIKKKGVVLKAWYHGIEVTVTEKGLQCSICEWELEGDKSPKHRSRVKTHIQSKHIGKLKKLIFNKDTFVFFKS
jgi:hypothetical protein